VITVRRATTDDAMLLLAWANDPVTRAAGFRPDPIDAATHRAWLDERLASPSSRLFVGLERDTPVGQVRLDVEADGRAEVGIAVAPGARRRGIGRRLLEAGLAAGLADPALHIEVFVARIRPGNVASLALFDRAGFRAAGTDVVAGVPCLVYERPAG
jgi:UDP-2,4-diacetamido-2,4,6-trideoxy-beta-L-altropyranose hydrolase